MALHKMLAVHSLVLTGCSCVGFVGHWLQFGIPRSTPWIPATVGLFILTVGLLVRNKSAAWKYLAIAPVLVFGLITTLMFIRFLPQEFQPLRKKIIFAVMSLSAWFTVASAIWYLIRRGPAKRM